MNRRTQARKGLTFVQANGGRLTNYSFSTEVEEAKARLRVEFPELEFLWDHETEEHVIVGTDTEGTQYLVFACKTFYEDDIRQRLFRADNTRSDAFEEIEKHNALVEAEQDYQLAQKIGEVGEKLAWAFGKDGLTQRTKVFIGDGIPNVG